jgi:predicted cupin superfamily sugar epimerase
MRLELSDHEIRALRGMKEFKESLADVNRQGALHAPCEGGAVVETKKYMKCEKCGLKGEKARYNSVSNLRYLLDEKHWKHWKHTNKDDNWARADGLYGKAAQYADGDWYGSH